MAWLSAQNDVKGGGQWFLKLLRGSDSKTNSLETFYCDNKTLKFRIIFDAKKDANAFTNISISLAAVRFSMAGILEFLDDVCEIDRPKDLRVSRLLDNNKVLS